MPAIRPFAAGLALLLCTAACQRAAQPSSVLLMTDLQGFLEGCPCDAAAAGGLERLVQTIEAARRGAGAAALVVGGDTFYGSSDANQPIREAQQQRRAAGIAAVLQRLAPVAIVPGKNDRGSHQAALRQLAEPLRLQLVWRGDTQSTFTQAGVKMAILGVDPQDDFEVLRRHALAVRSQGAQFVVAVLADADAFWESTPVEALRALPQVNVLVQGGRGAHEAPRILGSTLLVNAGQQAGALGILQLTPRGNRSEWAPNDSGSGSFFTYTVRQVDRQQAAAPWVEKLQTAANANLCLDLPDGATCPPARGPNERFVGSAKCTACHAATLPVTQASPHAHAWDSVRRKNKTCDVSCAACHSTGFMRPGGFCKLPEVGGMADVGCEACHGPGSGHVEAPTDRTRWGIMSRTVTEATCRSCHTAQTAPRFDYPAALSKVLGPGHNAAGQELPPIHHAGSNAPAVAPPTPAK